MKENIIEKILSKYLKQTKTIFKIGYEENKIQLKILETTHLVQG